MAISNYLENKILDATLKNVAYTSPATVYLALYTSAPTDADTGTEVASANGYARKPITFGSATNGSITTTSAVQFNVATGSWGTVTHIGIRDALTGGNLLYHGTLSVPQAISTNNQLVINAGQLTINLD